MDPRTRNLFLVVLGVLVVLTAGAAFLGTTSRPDPDAPPGAESMVGVIVGVEAASLDEVSGFDLRVDGGTVVAFTIGGLDNGTEFPPGHLVEHQATAQPVRVWYRTESGVRVAVRLEDAT